MSALVQAWLVVAGCGGGLVGFCVGAWRGRLAVARARAACWAEMRASQLDHLRSGHRLRLRPGGEAAFWQTRSDDGDPDQLDAALRALRDADERVVGEVGAGEGSPGLLAGGVPPAELLAAPVGRGYGPYLAAIGRDDPAGWYANLVGPDPPPEPGPAPELAWAERLLYSEALEWRRIDVWHSQWMEAFHADVAWQERESARWADEARWALVGSRSWPPPALEAVA